jgi:hypothetical protein
MTLYNYRLLTRWHWFLLNTKTGNRFCAAHWFLEEGWGYQPGQHGPWNSQSLIVGSREETNLKQWTINKKLWRTCSLGCTTMSSKLSYITSKYHTSTIHFPLAIEISILHKRGLETSVTDALQPHTNKGTDTGYPETSDVTCKAGQCWDVLEKLPIVQLLKNFSTFYGTQRFITMCTSALQVFLAVSFLLVWTMPIAVFRYLC